MPTGTISPCVAASIMCGDSGQTAALTCNIVHVLREVESLGSLYAATKALHMGYSNTLYSIKDIEEALGYKLLDRVCSKGSVLTAEGRTLVELYEKIQEETSQVALEIAKSRLSQAGGTFSLQPGEAVA